MTGARPEPEEKRSRHVQKPDTQALIAIYGVLASRFNVNFTVAWQIPLLGMTAQSFLIVSSVALQSFLAAQIALSVSIFLIGLSCILIMRRIEYSAHLDRPLMDYYERLLVDVENFPLLMHTAKMGAREIVFRQLLGDQAYSNLLTPSPAPLPWLSAYLNRLSARTRASQLWIISQLILSVVGAALPALSRIPH